MKTIYAKLTDRFKRTATVETFRFKALDAQLIDFLPGQFCRVIFDEEQKNNIELNKYLSFSCAPGKAYFELTKRLSDSEFSGKLNGLQVNDRVCFQMPIGNCVYKDDYKGIAFLIGGIGITPAISIIEYIVDHKLDTKVTLLYANRSDEDIAFKAELDHWRKSNDNIDVCYTVSKKVCDASDCHEGQIDAIFCRESIENLHDRKFFIYGPLQMVESMKLLAKNLGCKKENILSENFIGYNEA